MVLILKIKFAYSKIIEVNLGTSARQNEYAKLKYLQWMPTLKQELSDRKSQRCQMLQNEWKPFHFSNHILGRYEYNKFKIQNKYKSIEQMEFLF